MMSSNNTKKRRVGVSGGGGADTPPLPTDGENNNGLVHEELKMISSHMTNMLQMMSTIQGEVKHLQGEITRLTEKCDRMEKSIHGMKESQKMNNSTNQIHTINALQVTQNTISENMNSRFDDLDNKLKYHEVLLRNQQWKYSAPRPSREYWDSVEDDEGSLEMYVEDFLGQIKQSTEKMRYGTLDEKEIVIDAPITYNEEFLPHWKEFANALDQYQYCLKCLPELNCDTRLRLCGVDLSETAVLELLSKALESTHFNRFVLGHNDLGQQGIDFALNYVQSNQIIKEFFLYDNTIGNMSDIKQLCQVVKNHPSLEVLTIARCKGADIDGYEMMKLIMNAGKSKLEVLNLSGNDICTDGGTFISDFLTDDSMLDSLRLSNNQLGDNDAIAIAGALKHNENLRSLNLRNNSKMTEAGWEALRKAEFDDTSLNSASDSNHTCLIRYPSGDDEIQGLDTSEMNGNPAAFRFHPVHVRQKKVYSVLSRRNRNCSNVGHFDDVPVELLPDMLRTFQQYSNYHVPENTPSQDIRDANPLSLVYEVCRYWDKSLAVYELLSS